MGVPWSHLSWHLEEGLGPGTLTQPLSPAPGGQEGKCALRETRVPVP